ncbi:MAG: hypothetical protein R2860_00820 [Desulfobacterales bacterium]
MSAVCLDVAGIDQLGPSGNRVNVQIEAAQNTSLFQRPAIWEHSLYAVG